MAVTAHAVQELRAGATRATASEPQLHRLAAFLTSVAELARMVIDEDAQGIRTVGIPTVVENGCRVARDLCKSPE
jgi:hypothetical protein